MSYDIRKYDTNGINFKTIAINRGNDQSTFHTLVASHIVFCDPQYAVKDWWQWLGKIKLHLSSTNALFFNVWRELKTKRRIESSYN